MNPVTLLIIGIIILGLAIYFYWPVNGFYAHWQRRKRNDIRILTEDTLKYVYDCSYKNSHCNVSSIAGNLEISTELASEIVQILEQKNLIHFRKKSFRLTKQGEQYALRIIRVHRLLEKYMADETSYQEESWHYHADRDEHHLTEEATEILASKIGNPVFDPHGDPIPSASGVIPPLKGESLRNIQSGQKIYIQHVEDEPLSVYKHILLAGIHPGLKANVIKNNQNEILLQSVEGLHKLSLLDADNITVLALPETDIVEQPEMNLSQTELHKKVEIIGISNAIRGQQRRRLLDFGFIPGAIISKEMIGPLNDPCSYMIMDTMIALRENQSQYIFVKNI